jgi:hypothetical protein
MKNSVKVPKISVGTFPSNPFHADYYLKKPSSIYFHGNVEFLLLKRHDHLAQTVGRATLLSLNLKQKLVHTTMVTACTRGWEGLTPDSTVWSLLPPVLLWPKLTPILRAATPQQEQW